MALDRDSGADRTLLRRNAEDGDAVGRGAADLEDVAGRIIDVLDHRAVGIDNPDKTAKIVIDKILFVQGLRKTVGTDEP